jgi:hypothetical protein
MPRLRSRWVTAPPVQPIRPSSRRSAARSRGVRGAPLASFALLLCLVARDTAIGVESAWTYDHVKNVFTHHAPHPTNTVSPPAVRPSAETP